jgi:hypothetical protein
MQGEHIQNLLRRTSRTGPKASISDVGQCNRQAIIMINRGLIDTELQNLGGHGSSFAAKLRPRNDERD